MSVTVDEAQEWTTINVRFHRFLDRLRNEGQHFFRSPHPGFSVCGNKGWRLSLFTNGFHCTDGSSDPGMMALSIKRHSEEMPVTVQYGLTIRDSNGMEVANFNETRYFAHARRRTPGMIGPSSGGAFNFAERSLITESVLHEGSLVVEVRMRLDPSTPQLFIPQNPCACDMIRKMFMDEHTADVIFEVSYGVDTDCSGGGRQRLRAGPVTFYAHRFILNQCSTTLADLCEAAAGIADPISMTDIKPDVFGVLLSYIYGKEIPEIVMEGSIKDIIEVADKYGVANLKLEAEAFYVKSTTITTDYLMEHLLYAESKNCALLKERVMDYIVANKVEVLEKVSFQDLPGGPTLFTDMLAALARSENNDDNNESRNGESSEDNGGDGDAFSTMRICDLRRKAHKKGLDVDGSRESLIASLRTSEHGDS